MGWKLFQAALFFAVYSGFIYSGLAGPEFGYAPAVVAGVLTIILMLIVNAGIMLVRDLRAWKRKRSLASRLLVRRE